MNNHQILLVEDQEDIRMLVREVFETSTLNYTLHEAGDGIHALKLLETMTPSITILDVMLPGGITGHDLCQYIREKHHSSQDQPCIIMLTAKGQRADREKGLALGADHYLTKPFSPIGLIGLISDIIKARVRMGN